MGFRGKHKNRRDGNEPEIFDTIRAEGLMVYPMDHPVDALVGGYGYNWLVEVKNGRKAPLTAPQKAFLKDWQGQAVVLFNVEDAKHWAQSITATYGVIK